MNQSLLQDLLTISEIIDVTEGVYQDLGKGKIINPSKVNLDLGDLTGYPPYEGFMNAMPAYIEGLDKAGLKWVGGFQGQRQVLGLPYIVGLILLLDPHLGHFEAIVDGQWITNIRTGAQVVASLANLVKEPNLVVSSFGTGTIARLTAEAISHRYTIDRLYIWNHRRSSAEAFREAMESYVSGDIVIVEEGQAGLDADLVFTATHADRPLIQADWVKPGTLLIPLGSHQELANDLILKADKIICDHEDQALHRGSLQALYQAGQFQVEDIYANYGDLATGAKAISPEERAQEIIISIPIGMGAVDVAIAAYAYQKAQDQGLDLPAFDFLA